MNCKLVAIVIVVLAVTALVHPSNGAADAPPDRYTVTPLPGGSTVFDTVTGLTWPGGAMEAATYTDALNNCANFDFAGGGWHLAKISELLSVLDLRKLVWDTHGPQSVWAIDPRIANGSNVRSFVFSSTPLLGSPDQVYLVDFAMGTTSSITKSYVPPLSQAHRYFALCVR